MMDPQGAGRRVEGESAEALASRRSVVPARATEIVALLAVLIAFGVSFSGPVRDIDAWWHLATGKILVETRSFLDGDPFAFTSEDIHPLRAIILNGYWLAQIAFYASASVFGDYGLIVVRTLLLLGLVATVHGLSRKLGAAASITLFLLAPAGTVLVHFLGERPQLFSLVLAPVVLFLLEQVRRTTADRRVPLGAALGLALVLLVWANLHRGFMFGAALVALFVGAELVARMLERETRRRDLLFLAAVPIGAFAATLVNPNGFLPYVELLEYEGTALQQRSSEYMSPWTAAMRHGVDLTAYWWYLACVVGIVLWSRRRWSTSQLVVIAFLLFIGLRSFRYIPLTVFVSLPLVAVMATRQLSRRSHGRRAVRIVAGLAVVVALIVSAAGYPAGLGRTLQDPLMPGRFPVGATEFIESHELPGEMFNHFNWGGYLAWRLYPEWKVFIDGRALNLQAMTDYTYILWDPSVAPGLLDRWGIQTVIVPPANPFTGEPYTLVAMLDRDAAWHLVFRDRVSRVYVRAPARSTSRSTPTRR